MMTIAELITHLRRPGLRLRTGLWLTDAHQQEPAVDIAARLGIASIDARAPILEKLAPSQRFLGLDAPRVLDTLDAIAHSDIFTACGLVYHFDLLVAYLSHSQRATMWRELYSGLPYRPHGLIVMMPSAAHDLLPSPAQLDAWQADGRLSIEYPLET